MLSKLSKPFIQSLIRQHTKLCGKHLTPEIQLHLITPECPLWHGKSHESPFDDPFWAFYWPGGQALTRYILDHQRLFCGKNVLDVGSGCGSAAIASKLVGAKTVVANDIDPVALTAIEMNMEVNATQVHLSGNNFLTKPLEQKFDFILFGDMFYDPDFAELIHRWLKMTTQQDITVLIGDPGRFSFVNHPLKKTLDLLEEYALLKSCTRENNGFTNGAVWSLRKTDNVQSSL